MFGRLDLSLELGFDLRDNHGSNIAQIQLGFGWRVWDFFWEKFVDADKKALCQIFPVPDFEEWVHTLIIFFAHFAHVNFRNVVIVAGYRQISWAALAFRIDRLLDFLQGIISENMSLKLRNHLHDLITHNPPDLLLFRVIDLLLFWFLFGMLFFLRN